MLVLVCSDYYSFVVVLLPVDFNFFDLHARGCQLSSVVINMCHSGSPFQFTVGPITDGVANKVRAIGPGLQQGLTHESNEFTIYTREAGAGTLAIAIEGPSKADIECEVSIVLVKGIVQSLAHGIRISVYSINIICTHPNIADCDAPQNFH